MCIMCGIPTCNAFGNQAESGGDGPHRVVQGTPDAPFRFIDPFNNGRSEAMKWGDDRIGGAGQTVTYSANLSGINGLSGSALVAFEQALDLAFLTWSSVANIRFVEATSGRGMIDISAGGSSVDPDLGAPFGVLAFMIFDTIDDVITNDAFLFDEVEIIFDTAENWSANDDSEINFFAVALHEIGHALGMDHVPNIEDGGTLQNMNPFLSTDKLQGGDIAGISTLYGDYVWTNNQDIANFTQVNAAQTIYSRGGNDIVNGSDLSDSIFGGAGNDDIFGHDGNDLLVDTRGSNDIFGGDDNDTIIGGGGSLDAEGNSGNDTLIGGIGDDRLDGGAGNDILRGDPAGSFVTGDDILIAGAGNDFLEGGGGADTFVFSRSNGDNRIGEIDLSGGGRAIGGRDFEQGVDRIDLDAFGLSFAQVEARLTTENGDAVFTYVASGIDFTLTIEGVNHDDLTAADFIL